MSRARPSRMYFLFVFYFVSSGVRDVFSSPLSGDLGRRRTGHLYMTVQADPRLDKG